MRNFSKAFFLVSLSSLLLSACGGKSNLAELNDKKSVCNELEEPIHVAIKNSKVSKSTFSWTGEEEKKTFEIVVYENSGNVNTLEGKIKEDGTASIEGLKDASCSNSHLILVDY